MSNTYGADVDTNADAEEDVKKKEQHGSIAKDVVDGLGVVASLFAPELAPAILAGTEGVNAAISGITSNAVNHVQQHVTQGNFTNTHVVNLISQMGPGQGPKQGAIFS